MQVQYCNTYGSTYILTTVTTTNYYKKCTAKQTLWIPGGDQGRPFFPMHRHNKKITCKKFDFPFHSSIMHKNSNHSLHNRKKKEIILTAIMVHVMQMNSWKCPKYAKQSIKQGYWVIPSQAGKMSMLMLMEVLLNL